MVEFHFIATIKIFYHLKLNSLLDTWRKGSKNSLGGLFWPPQIRLLTMLWWFEKDTILTPWSKNLALQKHMSRTGFVRRLSLIGIDAIWQLSFGCLLMRTIASFLHYTGYLNFINSPIYHVLLLILVHVQLLSCLFFWLLASLRLKTMSLNLAQLFMKEMVKIYFGLLKYQVKFLINWSLEVF